MDVIELFSGSTKAIIDPIGAWLTNLSDDNGDVLFPKRQLTAADGSKKVRGGCHVCLPNFGPGGDSGLAQHGFGRTSLWAVTDQTTDRVELTLEGGAETYEALRSRIVYQLQEGTLSTKLELANTSKEPLQIAPGFHPYFALSPDETQVEVSGEKLELAELSGTLFREGASQKLTTARRTITMVSENLSVWAIWTDQLGAYVCVEPTHAGNAFLQTNQETTWLNTGDATLYTFSIVWI